MLRFDHVGVVVNDLDAAVAFFLGLGFEREGSAVVEGEVVDRINGLDGVRAELVMVRTPDRTGKLEVIKYHSPASGESPHPLPANRLGLRHICIEVTDLPAIIERLRGEGYGLVGELRAFEEHNYRLCYLRGPEGLIVELAEKIAGGGAASK
ncbi:MAG TPA: VOC family protein [Longimicrobiaceae bacterium]|nr:VOC family protein [Longimicrobiaceae bacterium]